MVGVALVSLTALSVFHNPQIVNRREGAARLDVVETGDRFDAPWLVAKDLVTAKLAEAGDPDDLDEEPSEAVQPHPSISNPDLKRHNARRQGQDRRPVGTRPQHDGRQGLHVADGAPAMTGLEYAQGSAVTADALHPSGPAPTISTAGGLPKPIVEAASPASIPKSNVPPVPPAPGSAA